MSNLPKPHYTLWQALAAALATAMKALEEVRALRREPGPPGEQGKPGKDAIGLGDIKLSYDGARKLTVALQAGTETKSFDIDLPIPIYRGIYKADTSYELGDMVTFGGSCWHCNEDTQDKPGSGAKSWQLAVKQGRDFSR